MKFIPIENCDGHDYESNNKTINPPFLTAEALDEWEWQCSMGSSHSPLEAIITSR